jgi:hypothetical protein
MSKYKEKTENRIHNLETDLNSSYGKFACLEQHYNILKAQTDASIEILSKKIDDLDDALCAALELLNIQVTKSVPEPNPQPTIEAKYVTEEERDDNCRRSGRLRKKQPGKRSSFTLQD